MSEHLAIESGLRNGEFFLEYQPIVELDRGRCLGAEALVRWRRPRGVSQPAEFLPFIPETRIFPDILPLGCSKGSLRTSLAWLKIHDAFMSINLQPEIIGRGGVFYLADRIGLVEVKHRIMLEIAAHGVPDRLGVDTLNHGVERELRYALDDVGAETNPASVSRFRPRYRASPLWRRQISWLWSQ
jgi:EAL domain-containing protein (putative c-di-GMP-specific phosphodiesterase class I)